MSCCVYYHEDAAGNCLYVGCARNPEARFYNHMHASSWARDVANIRVKWFETRKEALAFETQEIHRIKPPHNQAWQQGGRIIPANQGQVYLQKWLQETNTSIEVFAGLIGSTVKEAKSLATEVRHIHIPKAEVICVATDGYVPVKSWKKPRVDEPPIIRDLTSEEAKENLADVLSLCERRLPRGRSGPRMAALLASRLTPEASA